MSEIYGNLDWYEVEVKKILTFKVVVSAENKKHAEQIGLIEADRLHEEDAHNQESYVDDVYLVNVINNYGDQNE